MLKIQPVDTKALQIGNYVYHGEKSVAVTSVFRKGINAQSDAATGKITYIKASDIEPIPLSTFILRRLGMRQVGIRWLLPGADGVYIDRAIDKYHLSIGSIGSSVCRIYYVHQLQNILSAGFGIELRLR